ncbi:MAG: transglutaminase family protein, partial [Pseudomonadales bacterium]
MSIRIAIHHKTEYRFDQSVTVFPHVLRLRPAPHSRTVVTSYTLKVSPSSHFINWQQDPFGNYQARLVFNEKTDHLKFDIEVIAELTAYNPFDFFVESSAENFPFQYERSLRGELNPYLKKCHKSNLLQAWLAEMPSVEMPTNDFLVNVNRLTQEAIDYSLRFEPGVQTPNRTLQLRRGSCRDSAWLLVQTFRHLGMAARFVSGYLVQLAPDTRSLDGPSGPEHDFTDLHAWCEVYIPGAGWVGLDPTSGLFASEGHIPLACTPEPSTAAPISGATEKCKVEFAYSNEVTRIYEDPRVTKPYTEYQWSCADALGKMVDRQFEDADLRLTMGGEPTFVSIDDMESAQWNTDALGEHKLKLAKDLLIRLRDRFAPHALLHYGQGKWYPGEELPRWALGCFWRKDGTPLWRDPKLLARVDKDYGLTLGDADAFSRALAEKISVAPKYINRAYENALYYVWQEENLPVGVDPYHASMKDGLERMQLARVLHQGIDQPSGFVLPLGWDFAAGKWYSTSWPLKTGRVVLIPGDSPMGLRLPLDSLPLSSEQEIIIERDPFETREPLPVNASIPRASSLGDDDSADGDTTTATHAAAPQKEKPATTRKVNIPVLRTSLCVQPRDGKLFVFMPPLEYLEHYVDLIEKIEQVAADLSLPVIIEGYEPPRDSRIQKLLITPDPGVIEVNVHPAANWQELSDITTALYEEARLSRLATEKFMLDGRHTGTGGGNHVTLGGPTPADSPLLRRPDLIRSLVTYWQHHPSLSYLFSGMFIGPTSQAPRVDEGREEMLYELEVAFEQMPDGEIAQPWLVDRLLRNLLIDVTGNTHRAEFCIDKLYSPSGASGRQGILEFRGFEMPPHPRMALVQVLLLRCLVARFWKKPYRGQLIRWGTRLHDQFMLPHFVWSDIREVVRDLNSEGYPFQLEWLVPFEEFRFPYYGRLEIDDIHLEIRWAIEPWHVLGEEVSSFGTARYVDSSIERLQIKVSGITPGRHIVSCNGRRVPLRSTGKHGEFVAGVR